MIYTVRYCVWKQYASSLTLLIVAMSEEKKVLLFSEMIINDLLCFTCHHPQHEESSHWNHSDICVIDLVEQITAHAPFSSLSRDRADVFRSSQDFQHDSSWNWEKNILQLLWTLIVFGTPCVCVMMACHAHEATADRLCWSKAAPDRPMTRHNNDRSGLFSLMSSTDFPVQHPTSLWTQMNWIICSPSLSIL